MSKVSREAAQFVYGPKPVPSVHSNPGVYAVPAPIGPGFGISMPIHTEVCTPFAQPTFSAGVGMTALISAGNLCLDNAIFADFFAEK